MEPVKMSTVQPVQLPGDDALFHLLVDTVRDYAIFALDAEGLIVTWNRGAEQIKQYRADEVIGQSFSLFLTDEDREAGRPERLLRTAREAGRALDEGWRVRRDGSRFWASVVITALHDADGDVIGFAKVTRDLTERRLAEQALRRRERQLAEAQSLAGLGGWEWDHETGRIEWTDQLFRIYGIEPSDYDGTFEGYLARVHPEDRDRVRETLESAYREGGSFEIEGRIVRPDGSIRILHSRGQVVTGEDGRHQMFGSSHDVTELRAAQEKALQLAREQAARETAEAHAAGLRLLLRASDLLLMTSDYEGALRAVARMAVPDRADWCAIDLLVDGGLRRIAGVHADPDVQRAVERMESRYPQRRDAPHGIWRVIETGRPEILPSIREDLLRELAQDAEHLAMLRGIGVRAAVIVPLQGRGGLLGALTLVHTSDRRLTENDVSIASELGRHLADAVENTRLQLDLEERNGRLADQAAELELQAEELQAQAAHNEELLSELEATNEELVLRTEEAEEANRAKSDFLAAMSHELRTPLNAIFGYADLIQLGLHGPVTGKQKEALERIKRNQEALLVLINDLLSFARLEAGGLVIEDTELALAPIVADLEKVVSIQLDKRGLEYRCLPFPDDLTVRGDRERIEQILRNLLTNAIKFTDPGGRITVSVESDGKSAFLHVEDTGRGIPPDRMEAIFDPFVQIDRMRGESSSRGVGLGLAISRELAHAMGGALDVRSEVGRGSTFTLTLRRAGAGAAAPS